MAGARKRSHATASEEAAEEKDHADCPFSTRYVDKEAEKKKKLKRRKTDGENGEDAGPKIMQQLSPFAPSGKFKTHETMDIHYTVEPNSQWTEMTRYNSFVLNQTKYFSEGFIYVMNGNSAPLPPTDKNAKRTVDAWVARILEIRASDEHHVYARVYWMYWPEELPPGVLPDGKRTPAGRQPYHGKSELVASNHMDIINVVSVTAPATVKQWLEDNDDDTQTGLYWRQALDVRLNELSGVKTVCNCHAPENPDKTLIGCTSENCKVWLHEDCVKHDALLKTYERLGTDKAHKAPPVKKEEEAKKEEETESKRPLSPKEPPVANSASIDVKSDTEVDGDEKKVALVGGKAEVKEDEEEEDKKELALSQAKKEETPTKPQIETKSTVAKEVGRRKSRKSQEPNGVSSGGKPYLGLFEATLQKDSSPPMVEIHDLREGIEGEKTWLEPIDCLVCGARVK